MTSVPPGAAPDAPPDPPLAHAATPPPPRPALPMAAPVVPRSRVVPPGMDAHLRATRSAPPEASGEAEARPRASIWPLVRIVASAFAVAVLLRACVFEAYRIPSASMEQTLQPGDYVFVSKLGYGTRIPETIQIPFSRRYVDNPVFPGARFPGLGGPERGDVFVFHYPPEGGPIQTRTPYVKRLIGLPGDVVEIQSKQVVVNGDTLAPPRHGRQFWVVLLEENAFLLPDTLKAAGVTGRIDRVSDRERLVEGTTDVASRLRKVEGVQAVIPLVRRPGDGSAGFPASSDYSLDDWGPLRIPFAGWRIPLTGDTWRLYREAILKHEDADVQRVAGGFERDGVLVDSFTFSQDYYIALGDHRDDSADSRSWGFVPEDHLIGKAKLIYFSWDPVTGEARWDRALHRVR